MELIFVIGIVIWILNSAGKANKKAREAKSKQSKTPIAPMSSPMKKQYKQLQRMLAELAEPDQTPQEEVQETTLTPFSLPLSEHEEGFSKHDDFGCVGGSMLHGEHEGIEFPGHEHSIQTRDSHSSIDPEISHERLRLGASDMKRAVIMAEVLGRPVSRRRGGAAS